MTALAPSSIAKVWILAAGLVTVLIAGLAIVRIRQRLMARAAAWMLAAGAVLLTDRVTTAESPCVRMLAVTSLLLYAMKAVVGVESAVRLSTWRWLAFAAVWPGMRPSLFQKAFSATRTGSAALVTLGLRHLLTGVALIVLGRAAWSLTGSRLAAAALVLPGLSLVLHFGLFNIVAGAWRAAGVDASPLFRAPLRSTCLREFWGRRWNLAFSEMTAAAVYRPIAGVAGRRVGIAVAFLVSGLLHEVAISLPVRDGYGLPLLYFAIHGVGMLAERALARHGIAVDARPWPGRLWTLAWLLLPLPLLFHPPFLRGVEWPLVGLDG